jgi:hypothetical protein
MVDTERLAAVVEELIDVMRLQAKELEKLITRVEQMTSRLPEANQIAVVASQLSALHLRIQKLRGTARPHPE